MNLTRTKTALQQMYAAERILRETLNMPSSRDLADVRSVEQAKQEVKRMSDVFKDLAKSFKYTGLESDTIEVETLPKPVRIKGTDAYKYDLEVPKRPDRVFIVLSKDAVELGIFEHCKTIFILDYMHDWNYRDGKVVFNLAHKDYKYIGFSYKD